MGYNVDSEEQVYLKVFVKHYFHFVSFYFCTFDFFS